MSKGFKLRAFAAAAVLGACACAAVAITANRASSNNVANHAPQAPSSVRATSKTSEDDLAVRYRRRVVRRRTVVVV